MQSQRHSGLKPPSSPTPRELIWTLSPQAIFRSFSPRFSKITGWDDADWLGKPFQSFVHPEDIAIIRARFGAVLEGRTLKFDNVRCIKKDGSYLFWSFSLLPQNEGAGVNEVLVLGRHAETSNFEEETVHPLTSLRFHRDNEKRLSSTIVEYAGLAKLLEGMLGNAPVGFALLDEELRVICLNQAFSEMTGVKSRQPNRPFISLF